MSQNRSVWAIITCFDLENEVSDRNPPLELEGGVNGYLSPGINFSLSCIKALNSNLASLDPLPIDSTQRCPQEARSLWSRLPPTPYWPIFPQLLFFFSERPLRRSSFHSLAHSLRIFIFSYTTLLFLISLSPAIFGTAVCHRYA